MGYAERLGRFFERHAAKSQNAAHENSLPRLDQELNSILAVAELLVDQAKIGFIYQSSRLQRVVAALTTEVELGNPMELGIDQRH